MLIKPAPGIKVRDPASRLIVPEAGIEVAEHDTYWCRRLADGDVVQVKTTTAPKAPAKPAKE